MNGHFQTVDIFLETGVEDSTDLNLNWPDILTIVSFLSRKEAATLLFLRTESQLFRWFKFTLEPPNSITHGNLLSAIWDTSHWNFVVKFGLKTAWHISYDILWSLLSYVNFWWLQGRLSTFAKIRGPQKIKVFSMKERSVVDEAWGGFRWAENWATWWYHFFWGVRHT